MINSDSKQSLILKIVEACNFKCTFCSSTKLAGKNSTILDINQVYRFLERFPQTGTIILNGGDPLMVNPDYYWKLIEHLDANNLPANLSFTSNLWPFYKNPSKWADLFRHKRVGVATSFNYGPGRLKGDLTLFTEEDLWKVSDAMLEHVGYRPDFISVITEENEHLAVDNVILAKKMSNDVIPYTDEYGQKHGVECKLNYAMASGPIVVKNGHRMGQEGNPYQLSKIYEIYVKIARMGLTDWEFNTKQMAKRLTGNVTICPQNRRCDEGIRTIQPDGDYYSCGSFGDDKDMPIDFEAEMAGEFFTPLQDSFDLDSLKQECYSCPMFAICNGCRKTVKDMKAANIVDSHCKLMKTLAKDIMEINGL